MIIRLLLAVAILISLYLLIRWFKVNSARPDRQIFAPIALYISIGLMLFLALSGRLHWLFALIAATIPFAKRLLPMLRYLPLLRRWLGNHQSRREQGHHNQQAPANTGGTLSANEALAILEIDRPFNRDDITRAHRQLISKYHPDRGGSTYMAARVNQAKDLLMKEINSNHVK